MSSSSSSSPNALLRLEMSVQDCECLRLLSTRKVSFLMLVSDDQEEDGDDDEEEEEEPEEVIEEEAMPEA